VYTRLVKAPVLHAVSVITRSLWVRFHMGLILVVAWLAGMGSSLVLVRLGVRSMPVRYLLAVVLGYLLFLVGVRLWLGYARKALPHLQREIVEDEEGRRSASTAGEGIAPRRGEGWGARDSSLADVPTGGGDVLGLEGCLIPAVVTLLVAAVGGLFWYVLAAAPEFLGEAVVQLALAAALRKKGKAWESGHWSDSVLGATWGLGLAAGFAAVIIGLLVQAACPSAVTMFDALSQCR
jgi:hypothetical protein